MVKTKIIKCNRHGAPVGEHDGYFNGKCVWCLWEDFNDCNKRLATAEQKLGWSEATIEALQHTVEGLGQERDRLRAVLKEFAGWKCNGECKHLYGITCACCIAKQALEVPSGKD